MKTISSLALVMALVFSTTAFSQDQIQSFVQPAAQPQTVVPPVGVTAIPQNPMGGNQAAWSPSPVPQYPIGGNPATWSPYPVYPAPPTPTFGPGLNQNYNPYNPMVQQGQQLSVQYDQWGNPIVNNNTQQLFDSRLNPGANLAVNGSTRNVNRWEYDAAGNQVHVTGQQWLGADGQWHGNLNRQTVTVNNGVIQNNNELQMFSVNPNADDN